MSVYKVPQDVEADDKLLGPFSFRQFIYLIIAAMGIALGYGLSKILLPLAILPLPIIVFFAVLALPLKKDQPMEIYLAAVLAFYLKPRRRLWKADGVQSLIEIVEPKVIEEQRTKEFTQDEAERRLSYLANLVDSRGWAVRGVAAPQADNAMQEDVFFAAQQTEDMLDNGSTITHSFDSMIGRADAKRKQDALNLVQQSAATTQIPAIPDPYATLAPTAPVIQPSADSTPDPQLQFNPYPSAMRQAVIQPSSPALAEAATPQNTSQAPVPPDIMNLANNSDLSIETIAHEAKRIHEREEKLSDEEVMISLR